MLKNIFDLIVSSILLIIFSWLIILVALLVRLKLGKGILFIQERPGKNKKIVRIYKFRTMKDLRDAYGKLLTDEHRLTPFGQFMRKFSLDELPQLFNVIKGELSLVGPRPLLISYLDRYSPHQARRHEVKPGITGWAQVNGRNAISWEEKFDLDVWYVDNRSFLLDLKILWLTFLKVFAAKDTNQQGHATMPEFTGSIYDKTLQ